MGSSCSDSSDPDACWAAKDCAEHGDECWEHKGSQACFDAEGDAKAHCWRLKSVDYCATISSDTVQNECWHHKSCAAITHVVHNSDNLRTQCWKALHAPDCNKVPSTDKLKRECWDAHDDACFEVQGHQRADCWELFTAEDCDGRPSAQQESCFADKDCHELDGDL